MLQTAAHAQHIATLAEAKIFKPVIRASDGEEISTPEQSLRVEMAQGSRPIGIRLNMPGSPNKEFPPTSRMGAPIPETVVFERYLEPSGRDRALRERFRLRHRIDLSANSIFPLARHRERASRSLYGHTFPLSGKLEINLKDVSSEKEAIRLLCEPFGEIESIHSTTESHPSEGFVVRFLDRDVTLRAQQQLPLLAGVACFRVMATRSLKELIHSSGPSKTSCTTAPGPATQPVVSTTLVFADAVRGEIRRPLKASHEDWPSLPNLKPTAKKQLPTLPISPEFDMGVVSEEPQDSYSRPSGILSPVLEEELLEHPGDNVGPQIGEESLTPTPPELSGVVAGLSLLSTTPAAQPDGIACTETSVLGLVDVPPLRPSSHPRTSEYISIQSSIVRHSPVVQLGGSPQTGSQSRSGIERMTILVRELPLDTSQASLRDRFKSYGRLVSVMW